MEDAQFILYQTPDEDAMKEYEKQYSLTIEEQSYIDVDEESDTLRLLKETQKINRYKVTLGEDIQADDEILLSKSYMDSNQLSIGDAFELGGESYTIVGAFDRPDYLYVVEDIKGSYAIPESFGIAMVSAARYEKIADEMQEDEVSYYSVRYTKNSDEEAFRKAIHEDYMMASYTDKENNNRISTADFSLETAQLLKDVVVPVIFVLIVFIISVVLGRKIRSEQKMIGILKALGYGRWQLAFHYSFFGVFSALIGSALGVALAIPLESVLIPWAFVKLEPQAIDYTLTVQSVVVSFALPLVAYTMTVFVTAMVIMRKDAIAMIHGTGKRGARSLFRMPHAHISYVTKYRIRSIFGKPVRTMIVIIGICCGSLIFLFTYGMIDSLHVYVDESIAKMKDLNYQYYLTQLHEEKLQEGTEATSIAFECGEDASALSMIGVDDTQLLNTDLTGGGVADWSDGGYYITHMGATIYGVEEGDELVLKNSASLEEITITIDGVLDNDFQNLIFTSKEQANDILGVSKDCYNLVLAKDPIDFEESEISQTITKESMEQQIVQVYELCKSEVKIHIPFGLILCVFVMYIMVNMIVSENKTSISILKVLGYKKKQVHKVAVNVYHFIIPVAIAVGLLAGILFDKWYFWYNTEAFNTYVTAHMSWASIVKYVLLIVVSYMISLKIVERKVKKVDMTESLKDNRE